MKLETLITHAGRPVEAGSGAVTPSITLSTTFERAMDGSYPHEHMYSRVSNPNRANLEGALAALEGGARAFAFGSGQAAVNAVLQALAPGDHVLMPDDRYHGTRFAATEIFGRWGLDVEFVDMTNPATVSAALRTRRTRLIWVETPSNPRLQIYDIAALASMAKAAGALCAVDNTWASPILQRPLELGADIVMHSTTKYIGGHSDVLGGCLVCARDDEFAARLSRIQTLSGGVPSPFECWLLLRSLPTLALRVRAQATSAERVAAYLAEHPRVERVNYPGLATHPGHAVAARQMMAFGGMLSIEVRGGEAEAMRVAAGVRLFTRATSLGGIESLIEHRASIEGAGSPTPRNLLRLSIGLEHADDLIDDLREALGARADAR